MSMETFLMSYTVKKHALCYKVLSKGQKGDRLDKHTKVDMLKKSTNPPRLNPTIWIQSNK